MQIKSYPLAVFSILFLLFVQQIAGQIASFVPVNFDAVKDSINNPKSQKYYPILLDRYTNNDTLLTVDEYRYLYYGFTCQPSFVPYSHLDLEDTLNACFSSDTFTEADLQKIYATCELILKQKPYDLATIIYRISACDGLGKRSESRMMFNKLEGIVRAILSTGDGMSDSTAWSVICVNDEYVLLNVMGFEFGGHQTLTKSVCDYLTVRENDYGIPGFYFDVKSFFGKMFDNEQPEDKNQPEVKKHHGKKSGKS